MGDGLATFSEAVHAAVAATLSAFNCYGAAVERRNQTDTGTRRFHDGQPGASGARRTRGQAPSTARRTHGVRLWRGHGLYLGLRMRALLKRTVDRDRTICNSKERVWLRI
jgi:hypothetical protein